MATTPEPGWYPDPDGEAAIRWWDGTTWTDHVNGPSKRPAPAVQPAPPQGRRWPIAATTVLVMGAGIGIFLIGRSTGSQANQATRISATSSTLATTPPTAPPSTAPPSTAPPVTIPPTTIPAPETPADWFALDLVNAGAVSTAQEADAYATFAHTVCNEMDNFGRSFAGLKGQSAYDDLMSATAVDFVNMVDEKGLPADEQHAFHAAMFFGAKEFCPQWTSAMAHALPEFS